MLAFHPPDGLHACLAATHGACRPTMPITMQNFAKNVPKDLMYIKCWRWESQRHKLMSFMDDASKRKMEDVHLALTRLQVRYQRILRRPEVPEGEQSLATPALQKKKVYCLM